MADALPPSAPDLADDAALPGDGERTRLPDRVVTYWRLNAAFSGLVGIAVVAAIALPVPGIPDPLRVVIVFLAVLATVLDIAVVQPKRHALWWYAIGSDQIDLEHGWLVVKRTVVPMTRVQHVELKRGPLADRFDLAALEIFTAAGSVTIPALDRSEGERIRQQIADLARIADDL